MKKGNKDKEQRLEVFNPHANDVYQCIVIDPTGKLSTSAAAVCFAGT